MPKIILTLPDGNYSVAPNAAEIASVLAEPHRYFTDMGCGEIAIEYRGDEVLTYLGVRYIGENRFSIEWMMREGADAVDSASIILQRPLNANNVVTDVGGMPLHLPEASVISSEDALSIMVGFCNTGRVPQPWNAVRLSSLPPEAYYWGDPK